MTEIETVRTEEVKDRILGAVDERDFLGFVTLKPCSCRGDHLKARLVVSTEVDQQEVIKALNYAAWRADPKNQDLPRLEGLITLNVAHVEGLQLPAHQEQGMSSGVVSITGDTAMCEPAEFAAALEKVAETLRARSGVPREHPDASGAYL